MPSFPQLMTRTSWIVLSPRVLSMLYLCGTTRTDSQLSFVWSPTCGQASGDDVCQRCCEAPEDEFHRIWQCPANLWIDDECIRSSQGFVKLVRRGVRTWLSGREGLSPTLDADSATDRRSVHWRKAAGLWVDFGASWALATGLQPAPTCKRDGHWRDFMVGCPLAAAAAVLSCKVQPDRWIAPHLAVSALFNCCWWTCRVTQSVQRTPLCPAVDKGRGSKSVEARCYSA